MNNNWIPTPLFTPKERAAFVRSHGEKWVRGQEQLMGAMKATMDLLNELPKAMIWNEPESARWQAALDEAEKLKPPLAETV